VVSGFIQKVALSRQLPAELVDEQLAQGRIWSGETALERGLVDELGGEYKRERPCLTIGSSIETHSLLSV
jgi:ClpP class serine protease